MKKRLKSIIFISLIVLLTSACSSPSTETTTQNIEKTDMAAEIQMQYKSMKELKDTATNIIEGSVVSTENLVHGGVPFTVSKVKVISNVKGSFNVNSEIRIIETGGFYKPTGDDVKLDKSRTFEMTFNGAQVSKKGETYLLFLEKFEGPQVDGEVYIPVGEYQGKSKPNKDKNYEQQGPEEHKLKDYKPTKIEDLKNKLTK